ncbi:MAG: Hsp20/alpha crystallin family protein [Rhodanobacteraceae bacterium]
MPSRDLEAWMWGEAAHMLDRVDRLQREFFRLDVVERAQWEPPADVFETPDAVWVIVALPGVAAEHVVIHVRDDTLIVTGQRSLPARARAGVLHRIEIPHGRFERRLRLPLQRLHLARRELLDGCLYLQLRKVGRRDE